MNVMLQLNSAEVTSEPYEAIGRRFADLITLGIHHISCEKTLKSYQLPLSLSMLLKKQNSLPGLPIMKSQHNLKQMQCLKGICKKFIVLFLI